MIQLKNSVPRSQTALGVFSLIAVSLIVLNLLTPIQAANASSPQLIVATRNHNNNNNHNNNHKVVTTKHSTESSSGSSVDGMKANDRRETVPVGMGHNSPSDPYAFLREIYLDTEHKAITMILPHDEKQTKIKDDKKYLLNITSDAWRDTNGDSQGIKRSINSGDNDYLSELTKLIYLKEARFYNLPHSLQQLLFKHKHYNNNNNNNNNNINYHMSVQKFLPNGRYGRRSDPSLQSSSSLDFGTSRSELGKLRSLRDQLTRHSEFSDSSQDIDNNALGQQFVKLITTSIPANKQQLSSLPAPSLSSSSKLLDCSYSGLSNLFWCNSVVSSNFQ